MPRLPLPAPNTHSRPSLQQTRTKRGAFSVTHRSSAGDGRTVLDNSNFAKQNLKGISFQQSLCRSCDFSGSKLTGASFFDGDLSNANMEGAELSSVNSLPLGRTTSPDLQRGPCASYILATLVTRHWAFRVACRVCHYLHRTHTLALACNKRAQSVVRSVSLIARRLAMAGQL